MYTYQVATFLVSVCGVHVNLYDARFSIYQPFLTLPFCCP